MKYLELDYELFFWLDQIERFDPDWSYDFDFWPNWDSLTIKLLP